MAIASIIVQPLPGYEGKLAEELAQLSGISVHSVTPKQEIIILAEASSIDAINAACQNIEGISGVAGVFPTYVTTTDEEED